MSHFEVSGFRVYASIWDDVPREPGFTSRMSRITAPARAAIMAIESVEEVVHRRVEVPAPTDDLSALRT